MEITNQDTIKEKIVDFYKTISLESRVCRPLLDGMIFFSLFWKMMCVAS